MSGVTGMTGGDVNATVEHGGPSGFAQWLSVSDGPIYSVFHTPSIGTSPRTAVLMVPPFGWDDVGSHRARRFWAIQLANAGFPTLRIDLPGTAESHGDAHQPDLFGQWTRAVHESADWLLAQTGAARLAVIATGSGGTVACAALAAGAPIDDLVLWAVKGKGRAAMRELVAYSRVAASEFPEDAAGPAPADGIDVTGFLLSHETMAAMSAVDVATLDFPEPERRRALLLSRDELGVDAHLQTSLEAAGTSVESVQVKDYSVLMAHPQAIDLRRPTATIALTTAWLKAAPDTDAATRAGGDHTAGPDVTASVETQLPYGQGVIRETILNITLGGGSATAVISEPGEGTPRGPLAALLLNSGSIRKVGPHRMWVEVARRWAERGIPTVRVDFGPVGDSASIGDSGADERPVVTPEALTSPAMLDSTAELLGLLRERGLPRRFMLVGNCSGASLGFITAISDPEVDGVIAVNQQAFVYTKDLAQERMFERIVSVARSGLVKRLRDQGLSANEIRQVMEAVRHRYRRGRAESVEVQQHRDGLMLLDELRDRKVKLVMLFSREGELHDELFGATFQAELQLGRWPDTEIEELPTVDHMTRAIWLQKLTHARLDVAADDILGRLCSNQTLTSTP